MATPALKLVSKAEKATRSTVDTIGFSKAEAEGWELPPFQRPLKVNKKVRALGEVISANDGVIPGVITFGVIGKTRYLLDGQHRREAFYLSGCTTGYADVRICQFDSMAEMGEEFVETNSKLVTMKPDDVLRGLEASSPRLQRIRKACPWVGYSHFRANDSTPIVSMSACVRFWSMSEADSPSAGSKGQAIKIIESMTDESERQMVDFLSICHTAWGRDRAVRGLWSGLNFVVTAWMFRRIVLTQYSQKSAQLTRDMFTRCLMEVGADSLYVAWLSGRYITDMNRAPCYNRIKTIFVRRMAAETGKKISILCQRQSGVAGDARGPTCAPTIFWR